LSLERIEYGDAPTLALRVPEQHSARVRIPTVARDSIGAVPLPTVNRLCGS
jgi:hypothetical protein